MDLENAQKLLYFYELQYQKINQLAYKSILRNFVREVPLYQADLENAYGDYEQKFNYIHGLVLERKIGIQNLYTWMEQYQYNIQRTILEGIHDICSASNEKTEQIWIERLLQSPCIHNVHHQNHTYNLETTVGTITFQKAPLYLKQMGYENLSVLAQSRVLQEDCHHSTEKICKEIPDSEAYTTLCTASFKGQFYHSFTVYQNHCIDLNYNCVLDKEQYMRLEKMTIVKKTNHQFLQKEIRPFQNQTYPPLLLLALDTQFNAISHSAQEENLALKEDVYKK